MGGGVLLAHAVFPCLTSSSIKTLSFRFVIFDFCFCFCFCLYTLSLDFRATNSQLPTPKNPNSICNYASQPNHFLITARTINAKMVNTYLIISAVVAVLAIALGGAYVSGALDPLIKEMGIFLFKAKAEAEAKKLQAQGLKEGEDFVKGMFVYFLDSSFFVISTCW